MWALRWVGFWSLGLVFRAFRVWLRFGLGSGDRMWSEIGCGLGRSVWVWDCGIAGVVMGSLLVWDFRGFRVCSL